MSNQKFYRLLRFFILVCFMSFSTLFVYAVSDVGPQPIQATKVTDDPIVSVAENAWATAVPVIQILAVAAVVIAGLRYMFASADGKADIKKQTIILIVGAIFVFGAVKIADMIYNAASDIIVN